MLSFAVFVLAALAPSDPAEEYAHRIAPGGVVTAADVERARRELGLDRPFAVRYAGWLVAAAQGDFGRSFARQTRVRDEIARRVGPTAELAAAALALTVAIGVPLGIIAALAHRHWLDHVLRVASLFGASLPGFFLAYVLILLLATELHLFPVAGRQGPESLVIPALTLCAGPAASTARLLRASLLETLSEDYVRTAQAKGMPWSRVVLSHALPNAAIPVVTVLGGVFGHLLAGAVIVEFIFAWPGLGLLTVSAVAERDYPMIEGLVMFAAAVFLGLNLLVDLSYSVLDPRVKLGARL
jgi:peptide/nickel transport system permease protein